MLSVFCILGNDASLFETSTGVCVVAEVVIDAGAVKAELGTWAWAWTVVVLGIIRDCCCNEAMYECVYIC